jgi:hypothetical protein
MKKQRPLSCSNFDYFEAHVFRQSQRQFTPSLFRQMTTRYLQSENQAYFRYHLG